MVERAGRSGSCSGGRVLGTPFLDIGELVSTGGESGLLSMAFAPDYARSGRFYVYYTDSDGYIRIDQFRRSAEQPGPRAAAARERLVMRVPHQRFNHKGGQIQFGPDGQALRGLRRRRRGRRPGPQRAEPRPPARQDGPDRAAARRRLQRSRATTPSAAARARGPRSTPTGCATRTASRSTAARGHLDVGDVGQDSRRGDRLRAEPPRPRARAARRLQLRLERLRGAQPLPRGRGARARAARDRALAGRRLLLDHRRLRDPRPRARTRPATASTSTATTATPTCGWPPCAPQRAARGAERPGCRTSSRSARTAAAASTRSRSTGPCTGSARRATR